ncbi:MAG TPA: OsmC family protein [Acidimicrobiales bacterium]
MSMTDSPIRNGVDTATLFATLDAVKAQPEAAQFKFRVRNRWVSGTHSQGTVDTFFGVGEERSHDKVTVLDADHPAVLVGTDKGPTPVEYVLAGLAACLTAGIGNIAAARGVELTKVESTVEGDIDLQGILGLSDQVRNGFEGIRVSFSIEGKASEEQLRRVVEQSRSRSAVYDIVTNGVPVSVDVTATTAG